MKNISQQFESELSKAMSIIVSASYNATVAMLDEAFFQRERQPLAKVSVGGTREGTTREKDTSRRSEEDIKALGQRLLEEIRKTPGERMATLASRMGVTPRVLQVPVKHLTQNGKIKTAGARQFTTYFPLPQDADNGVGAEPRSFSILGRK